MVEVDANILFIKVNEANANIFFAHKYGVFYCAQRCCANLVQALLVKFYAVCFGASIKIYTLYELLECVFKGCLLLFSYPLLHPSSEDAMKRSSRSGEIPASSVS